MTVEELAKLIAKAEFHKFLQVELESASAEDGILTLKLPFDTKYTIFAEAGGYHGGIIASLVDVAGAMVCSLVHGSATPTINMRIDFLKSPRKIDLYADGKVVRIGRGIGVADVTIRGEDGTFFAVGRGTFSTAQMQPGKQSILPPV